MRIDLHFHFNAPINVLSPQNFSVSDFPDPWLEGDDDYEDGGDNPRGFGKTPAPRMPPPDGLTQEETHPQDIDSILQFLSRISRHVKVSSETSDAN